MTISFVSTVNLSVSFIECAEKYLVQNENIGSGTDVVFFQETKYRTLVKDSERDTGVVVLSVAKTLRDGKITRLRLQNSGKKTQAKRTGSFFRQTSSNSNRTVPV
jgi:hypothetical protein